MYAYTKFRHESVDGSEKITAMMVFNLSLFESKVYDEDFLFASRIAAASPIITCFS